VIHSGISWVPGSRFIYSHHPGHSYGLQVRTNVSFPLLHTGALKQAAGSTTMKRFFPLDPIWKDIIHSEYPLEHFGILRSPKSSRIVARHLSEQAVQRLAQREGAMNEVRLHLTPVSHSSGTREREPKC